MLRHKNFYAGMKNKLFTIKTIRRMKLFSTTFTDFPRKVRLLTFPAAVLLLGSPGMLQAANDDPNKGKPLAAQTSASPQGQTLVKKAGVASRVNPVQAETVTIRGTVYNTHEPPEPLPGATIRIKNTNSGTTTDEKGYFTLNAKKGDVLVFSMISFSTFEFVVKKAENNLSISLKEDVSALNEVVVVGFSEQQKKHVASAVSSVNVATQVEGKPITQISQALQGGVTGINVTQGSGLPGSDVAKIVIRGNSNLSLPEPFVLVDGVPMNMNDLDPATIESITVLKDAAAAAIYGSRAANGVVLVTTKRGVPGKILVRYDAYAGVQTPTYMPEIVDAPTYARMYNEAQVNFGRQPLYTEDYINKTISGEDPLNYPNTNWQDLILDKAAPMTSHTLAVSGGNSTARFAFTGTYLYQKGMLPVNDGKKFNIRANTSVSLTDKFTLYLDALAIKSYNTQPLRPNGTGGNRILQDVFRVPPTVVARFPDVNGRALYGRYADIVNPLAYAEKGGWQGDGEDNAVINVQPKWGILPGLNFNGQFSFKINSAVTQRNRDPYNFYDYNTGAILQSWGADRGSSQYRNTSYYAAANLDYTIDQGDHYLFLLGGYSQDERADGPWSKIKILSFYSKANYSFKDKYLLELTVRGDGSSKFGPGNKWGVFPSAAIGWNMHNEAFMQNLGFVSNFKLRGSYGLLGNEGAIGPYRYQSLIGTTGIEGTLGNPDITWETVSMLNAGVDIGLLKNNKIELTLDYYDKLTTDLLMSPPISYVGGFSGTPPMNGGKVRNTGFEIALNYNERINEDFTFYLKPGFTYNQNRIEELGRGAPYISGSSVHNVGDPIRSYYGYASNGLLQEADFDAEGDPLVPIFAGQKPGDIRYVDQDADGVISSTDLKVLKRFVDPKTVYFGNFGMNYKRFDFEMLVQGAGGRATFYNSMHARPLDESGDGGIPTKYYSENYWTPERTDAEFPRLLVNSGSNKLFSDFWFRNGAYTRIKFLQLGYNFHTDWLQKAGIAGGRVYVNAQNPFTWSELDLIDPESMGTEWTYPVMKVYTFGFNLKF
jgi:TonB-linked SusC/RagA family outer membrane protein